MFLPEVLHLPSKTLEIGSQAASQALDDLTTLRRGLNTPGEVRLCRHLQVMYMRHALDAQCHKDVTALLRVKIWSEDEEHLVDRLWALSLNNNLEASRGNV